MIATIPRSRSVQRTSADHLRFLDSVVGRLLELVVFSVEGIRERVQHRIPAN